MASIAFGIEFDRIAPPVPTIAAAAEYDAARRRRTIDFFFEQLRPRCIGRLQRLDGDPATGWNRRSAADGSRPMAPSGQHCCHRTPISRTDTGRVARSEYASKQRLQVPDADTRSSPALAGTGLVKFVRLGGQAAFAVA